MCFVKQTAAYEMRISDWSLDVCASDLGHGATVVQFGEKFDDAYAHARELEVQQGLTFVHPFDEPDIMAGQGTVALEMLEDAPEIDRSGERRGGKELDRT